MITVTSLATDELTDEQRSASECASQCVAQWVVQQTSGAERHLTNEHSVDAETAARMAAPAVLTGACMAAVALAKASGLSVEQVASAWHRINVHVVPMGKGGNA